VLGLGVLAGFAVSVAVGARLLRRDLAAPTLAFRSEQWSQIGAQIAALVFCQGVASATVLIDQLFLMSQPAGSISTVGYAQRVTGLFVGLGATVMGRAAIPLLSRVTDDGEAASRPMVRLWSSLAVAIGLLAAFLGWFASDALVAMLFERGRFSAADTKSVTAVLRLGLLQLPFHCASVVLFYALISRGRAKAAAAVGVAAVSAKIAANAWFVAYLGPRGVMLGTTAMFAVLFFGYLFIERTETSGPSRQ
jgi:putative peptidoglycan lipid II flippase